MLSLLVLLSSAVTALAIARWLKLPSMLAYLAVGTLLGPYGLNFITDEKHVEEYAEYGIVFLMFSIGLEFSFVQLQTMRRLVFGFGGLQMGLTVLGTSLVTLFGYGQDWRTGVVIGLVIGMSSTAIVARLLSERLELHSEAGKQTMGVLLFQDLAVVPCLILFPALAQPAGNLFSTLGLALLQAIVLLALMIWAGKHLIRSVYYRVAHLGSDELFVVVTLWLVVALAFATGQAGLSLSLGAFVGGMLISDTAFRHQVEADIRPFRDLLLGLFFVSIGMLLDLGYVLNNLPKLLLAVLLLIAAKGGVVFLVARCFGSHNETAICTAAQLAQAGEFGLVLLELAYGLKLVSKDVFQITLTAMLLSMFSAPVLIAQSRKLGNLLGRGEWAHKAQAIYAIAASSLLLSGHIILCGYGRTGRRVARFLREEKQDFLALDIDPYVINATTNQGHVVFGNGDRPEVLQAAGIARAKALVVTYDDNEAAKRTIALARRLHPDLLILARASDDQTASELRHAGANEVIPEVLEGSLMLAAETLIQLGLPSEHALNKVREVRARHYRSGVSGIREEDKL